MSNLAPPFTKKDPRQYRGGAKARLYTKVSTNYLAEYFNTSSRNVLRWIKEKKFDPTSIDSIHEYRQLLKEK